MFLAAIFANCTQIYFVSVLLGFLHLGLELTLSTQGRQPSLCSNHKGQFLVWTWKWGQSRRRPFQTHAQNIGMEAPSSPVHVGISAPVSSAPTPGEVNLMTKQLWMEKGKDSKPLIVSWNGSTIQPPGEILPPGHLDLFSQNCPLRPLEVESWSSLDSPC